MSGITKIILDRIHMRLKLRFLTSSGKWPLTTSKTKVHVWELLKTVFRQKLIKHVAGETWEPSRKMRWTSCCRQLPLIFMLDLYGASYGCFTGTDYIILYQSRSIMLYNSRLYHIISSYIVLYHITSDSIRLYQVWRFVRKGV